ncbi:unnamed protein product [Withania somnifera]
MRIVIGNLKEALHPDTLRAALAEFISMFIFVSASEGCAIAFTNTLMSEGAIMPGAGFISTAISHAFSLFVAVSVSANISGGHVNPAVTFAAFIGGYITFYRSVLYWIAQLLGSMMALFDTSPYALRGGATPRNAIFFEIVMTFGLRGDMECIAPITVGFFVGANTLAGGGLYGATMNPAMAFGQAIDSRKWKSHRIYRLGPFVGAAIAALVYEIIFIDSRKTHWPLPAEIVERDHLKEYLIEVEKSHTISITL